MMARYGKEMGSIGARGQKRTAMRRPLLVGALAAGVVALGAATAVAVGPLGSPSPSPSITGGQTVSIFPGTGTSMMGRTGTASPGTSMMGRTGTASPGTSMMDTAATART